MTAHDDAGNWATDTLTVVLDQTPPNDGSLTAIAGNAKVTLNWSAFSDDGSGLASTDPYKLVFSTGGYPAASCTSGSQLYTGSNTSFTHTKLKNGTLYYYRVCALDNAGNISTGVTVSAMPQGGKRR
ncbi:MAG: fibronectin type III domain-containing protein [candidate division NC10 bacterium]